MAFLFVIHSSSPLPNFRKVTLCDEDRSRGHREEREEETKFLMGTLSEFFTHDFSHFEAGLSLPGETCFRFLLRFLKRVHHQRILARLHFPVSKLATNSISFLSLSQELPMQYILQNREKGFAIALSVNQTESSARAKN